MPILLGLSDGLLKINHKSEYKGKTDESLGRKATGSKSDEGNCYHDTTASCHTVQCGFF